MTSFSAVFPARARSSTFRHKAALPRWLATLVLVAAWAPAAMASDPGFFGLLRVRDLTPFGYLRLDMRPGFSGAVPSGTWSIETDFAYQNTWVTSPEVEKYLDSLPVRRELGPDELQAIRGLPGENYLVDLELSRFDLALAYQLSNRWGAYLLLSGSEFGGGFLDGTIEKFHELLNGSGFGRPASARNDYNVVFDLKSIQYATFEPPGRGGMLDPVFGVRYTGVFDDERWKIFLESAIKLPLADRHEGLSTGRTDVGVQLSLQRYFSSNALYFNLAVVYYAGATDLVPEPSQLLPTIVVGYERRLTSRTNVVLQGYVSRSVYARGQTELGELVGTKYQISAGVHHRRGPQLVTFALMENLQNLNNTPDIGFQLGWSINPGWD